MARDVWNSLFLFLAVSEECGYGERKDLQGEFGWDLEVDGGFSLLV